MGSKFPVYTLRATSPELLRRGDDASRVLMHELDMMRDTRTRWRPKFHEYQPLNAPWVLLSAAARDVSTRGVDTRPWHTPWPDVLCGAPSSAAAASRVSGWPLWARQPQPRVPGRRGYKSHWSTTIFYI